MQYSGLRSTLENYHGISYSKRDNKYRATIRVNGIEIWIGSFKTEEGAVHARIAAELQYW